VGGTRHVIRFHFAHLDTGGVVVVMVMVMMVMVIIPTPAHGPHQYEKADPPPAVVLHRLSSLDHTQRGTVFSATDIRLTPGV